MIMSDRNLFRVFPELAGKTEGDNAVTIGLVRVRPGTDVVKLSSDLQAAMPADVRVLTLEEFISKERDFWDKVAPIGTVFYIGVVMGFIVGCVICYQVLFSDISDRIGEFATLKAMGYSNLRLFRVVVMQGVYLAVLGYLAGLAVSLAAFRLGPRGDRSAAGPVAEQSAGHPGAFNNHVRPVRSLRGAQAAVGRSRTAFRLRGVRSEYSHERYRNFLDHDLTSP